MQLSHFFRQPLPTFAADIFSRRPFHWNNVNFAHCTVQKIAFFCLPEVFCDPKFIKNVFLAPPLTFPSGHHCLSVLPQCLRVWHFLYLRVYTTTIVEYIVHHAVALLQVVFIASALIDAAVSQMKRVRTHLTQLWFNCAVVVWQMSVQNTACLFHRVSSSDPSSRRSSCVFPDINTNRAYSCLLLCAISDEPFDILIDSNSRIVSRILLWFALEL